MKTLRASIMSAVNGKIVVTSNVVNSTYGKKYANISFKNQMQAAYYCSGLDKNMGAVIVPIGTAYSIFINR